MQSSKFAPVNNPKLFVSVRLVNIELEIVGIQFENQLIIPKFCSIWPKEATEATSYISALEYNLPNHIC